MTSSVRYAVDQLIAVAERAGVAIYAPSRAEAGDGYPVEVAKDSIELAEAKVQDLVIVDTASVAAIDPDQMRRGRGAVSAIRRRLPD
ncbi:hypothetical protein SVIOM342S_05616 [Streptomyces violaceorubidus]